MTVHQFRGVRLASSGAAAIAFCALCATPQSARADDLGVWTLFDQPYRIHRFDYNALVRFQDAKTPSRTIALNGVQGAHDLGGNNFLVCSNTLQISTASSYKNYVIEVRLLTDAQGLPTGLSHTRTILTNDLVRDGYDLDPRGLTINDTLVGLGSGADLVVSSGGNMLRAFDFPSGAPVSWNGGPSNGFSTSSINFSTEDVVFVPQRSTFYTAFRSPESTITSFNRMGRIGPAFRVGKKISSTRGLPAGLTLLHPSSTFPRVFDSAPAVMVCLDNFGPGLEVYDIDSRPLGFEPLSNLLTPGRTPLPLHGSTQELWLSAVTADFITGRIMLFNRGNGAGQTDVFVLTPIPVPCPADFNLDGASDFFDFDDFINAFENGLPRADFNHDGAIDFFDYDEFVVAFEAG
ncbi:MAG: hypothetical protein AABZ53_09960, partial [Planctomycetota bacterium]